MGILYFTYRSTHAISDRDALDILTLHVRVIVQEIESIVKGNFALFLCAVHHIVGNLALHPDILLAPVHT